MKKIGVVRFLGTNCDRDIWQAVELAGHQPEWLWYDDLFNVDDFEGFVIPGGFSYGDYLRSGALAAKSKVMKSVAEAHAKGKPILGICNGFQILCECGLLPGVLLKNESTRFVDKWVRVKLTHSIEAFAGEEASSLLPVAHGDGRYFVNVDDLKTLQDKENIWLTYEENPNGSVADIAGVKSGNTAGLMPHPERAVYSWMGGDAGLKYFSSL